MAEQYPKLVNKQYNSPIQLYSDRNVREILERETKVLANGAIGIDFNNPISNKPANLQNSAVLRMLEEEENRKRSGQPGSIENNSKPLRDQIVWPPKPNVKRHTTLKDVTISGLKRVAWPPPSDSEEFVEQEPVQSQGGPQYSSKSESSAQNNQAQLQQPLTSPAFQQQSQQPKSPITTNNTFEPIISPTATSSLSGAQSPYQSAPLSPNISKSPGIAQNQIPAQPRYQPAPVKQVEPPPSTITLRPQAPVSQAPPPLVTSQPATATLRGGKHLRGDLKWPPENVRERMVAEEHHLEELAKGPALRPRKNCKDYSAFFAKHALGHVYPGYKIPPGTQYYDHNPVM